MMRLVLAIIALSSTGAALAECKKDFSTTFESNAARPKFQVCGNIASGRSCRELNTHPRDFRNAMRNYMVQGGGLDEQMTINWFQDRSQFAKTFCNDYGQCASVTMTMYFNMFDVNVSAGVVSTRLTIREALGLGAVREFDLTVHMPDDTPLHTQGYSPMLLEQNAPLANIPADSKADPAKKGSCLDNNGDTVNDPTPNTTGSNAGAGRLPALYYGGALYPWRYAPVNITVSPSRGRICGISSITDGPSQITCQMR